MQPAEQQIGRGLADVVHVLRHAGEADEPAHLDVIVANEGHIIRDGETGPITRRT